MRHLLLFLLLAASPATATQRVSLRPFEGSMGFEPRALQPITSQHPLYGRILLEDVRAMPDRIGSFLMRVTTSSEFNQSLHSTLASANMLARSPAEARARLRVTWRRFHLPLQIGLTTRATVAVHYELSRIDNGQVIYSREIVTQAVGRGGNGAIGGKAPAERRSFPTSRRLLTVSNRRHSRRLPTRASCGPSAAFPHPLPCRCLFSGDKGG